jgi:predicted DNA-binding transcriptional regulator AlpA
MGRLLTPEQTAELLQITVNSLAEMRQDGNGPDFVRLGHRTVRYREDDVDEFIMSNLVELDTPQNDETARRRAAQWKTRTGV